MNKDNIEELRKVFLNMAADFELGKVSPELVTLGNANVKKLNEFVDDQEFPCDNLSPLQEVINFCYQYYRFRDLYLANA